MNDTVNDNVDDAEWVNKTKITIDVAMQKAKQLGDIAELDFLSRIKVVSAKERARSRRTLESLEEIISVLRTNKNWVLTRYDGYYNRQSLPVIIDLGDGIQYEDIPLELFEQAICHPLLEFYLVTEADVFVEPFDAWRFCRLRLT